MSSAEGAEFANVTYAQYQTPFGGKGKSVDWLGLDNIAAMTRGQETSLRIDLHGCGLTDSIKEFPLHAMEIYKTFRVNSADKGYSVFIPTPTTGNNTVLDGWVLWNQRLEGPKFSTFDHDIYRCSGATGHTGFWFYGSDQTCLLTNLNGVRKVCTKDNRYDQTLLTYHNNHIKQASMWLRPRHFLEDSKSTDQTGDHYASNA